MKNKKILAGVLAVTMMLAAGCAEKEESEKDNETASVTEEITAETTASEAADEPEVTEIAEDPSAAESVSDDEIPDIDIDPGFSMDLEEPEEETPASDEELKEVQELVRKYAEAAKANDYAALVTLTDVDMLQFMSTGNDSPSQEELINALKGVTDDTDMTLVSEPDYSGMTFGEPRCYNSRASIYNDFLSSDSITAFSKADAASKYKIDGLYSFKMSGSSDTQNNDNPFGFSSNIDMDLHIFRINGEWKVDAGYGMMVDLFNAFSSMNLE